VTPGFLSALHVLWFRHHDGRSSFVLKVFHVFLHT
jgi:hypothetical protein